MVLIIWYLFVVADENNEQGIQEGQKVSRLFGWPFFAVSAKTGIAVNIDTTLLGNNFKLLLFARPKSTFDIWRDNQKLRCCKRYESQSMS